MKRAAHLAVCLGLTLAGCHSAPRDAPAQKATPGPAAADTVHTLAAARAAAFPKGLMVTMPSGGKVRFAPGKLVEAPFGPVLVSPGEVVDPSHADSGLVAVHYLKPGAKGFTIVRAFPKAVESGSFGQFSDWAVSAKFSDLPVVYVEGGGTWQGYTCGWTTLTELRPEGPVELVTFEDSFDNGGAVEDGAQQVEGKIANIVRGQSFDVVFTGTRSFTAHYRREGNQYVLEGGDKNALDGC